MMRLGYDCGDDGPIHLSRDNWHTKMCKWCNGCDLLNGDKPKIFDEAYAHLIASP